MKKEYQGQCIFCGQPISTNQVGVGYTKTKRKTINLFHEACFMGCTVKGVSKNEQFTKQY